ncbi:SDR family NAD(P)-dependent oxidoreductase [Methylobacterium sp. P31]
MGLEIARTFAAAGAPVIVGDSDGEGLERAAREIRGLKTGLCDVSDRNQIERMVGEAVAALGGLDVLVNNAGVSGPAASVEDMGPRPDAWEQVMKVDLTGTFNVTRLSIPHLKKSGAGAIITMSSLAGWFG